MDCPLLPGLPTDIAMLCLAKLPIDAVARARAVSRAFASALRQYPPLGRLPQGLAVFSTGKEYDNSMTWLFLSCHPDLRSLVVPFFFLKGGKAEACTKTRRLQVIETGTPLMLVRSGLQFRNHHNVMPRTSRASDCPGNVEDGYLAQGPGCLQGFDLWQMKWLDPRATPWGPMPVDRWDFATAHIGKHVYFVGGKGPRGAASSAEILNLDTWTWETLPPMHRERGSHPSAFAIGGRLVVLGGASGYPSDLIYYAGEFYDPTTNAWTLVGDNKSHYYWWNYCWPHSIAVVKDVAYAAHAPLRAVFQLKMDSPSFKNVTWHRVGQLPRLAGTETRLLSVQDELWVVLTQCGNYKFLEVFSCKPHLDNQGLHWKRLHNVAHPTDQV